MGMFNPEIRTVEGSNIGTYNPPTVDYSGILGNIGASIGNALSDLSGSGKGGGGGESASDKKMAALQDFTSNWIRASEMENKTQAAVTKKQVYLNSVKEYPLYQEDFKKLMADFNGETYLGSGSDLKQVLQGNITTWATSDPEGQRVTSLAMIKSGGDPVKMDALVTEGYYQDQAHKASMRRAKEESEAIGIEEKQRKYVLDTKIRPQLAKKYSEMFNEDVSSEAIQLAYQKAAAEGVDPDVYVLDALQAAYDTRKAQLSLELNTYGADPAAFNLDTILSGYTSAINTLKTNKDALSRAMAGQNLEDRAKLAANFFKGDPIGQAIILGGNVNPDLAIAWMGDTTNKATLSEAMKYKVGVAGNGSAPNVAGIIDPDMTPTDSPSVIADRWANFAQREEILKIQAAPPAAQDALVKLGTTSLSGFQYNPNVPEGASIAYKNIGSLFITTLPEIDKDRSSTKSNVVSQILSDSTFTTFEEIGKGNASYKADLYNKAAQYSVNTIRTVEGMFFAQMKNMENVPNYPPFILSSDKNGVVSLQVNPEAVKVDPELKKAMGMYRYSGGKGGLMTQEIPATVADPQKVLDNYTAIMSVGGSSVERGTAAQIRDYVKTLNIISRQSNRIPIDIRNRGADPLQIIRSITVTSE